MGELRQKYVPFTQVEGFISRLGLGQGVCILDELEQHSLGGPDDTHTHTQAKFAFLPRNRTHTRKHTSDLVNMRPVTRS